MEPTRVAGSDEPAVPANLTIGDVAARAGVTAEAIRVYEREGVIPQPDRPETPRPSGGEARAAHRSPRGASVAHRRM